MIPGQKILVLRYGNNIKSNCIEEHKKLIEKNGYCWFGKIGTCPSNRIIDVILNQDNPEIILYAKSGIYICRLDSITKTQPDKGYPEYYREDLFAWSIYPKIYFKITSMDKIPFDDLNNLYICSTRSQLPETLYRSMASFFLAEYPDEKTTNVSSNKKSNVITDIEKKEKPMLNKNDCVYRKEGKCTCKSSVNYKYECERPSMCIKQKLSF